MSLADRLALTPEFGRRRLGTETLDRAILDIEKAFPGVEKRYTEDVDAVIGRLEKAVARSDWQGVTTGDVAVGIYEHLFGRRTLDPRLCSFLNAEAQVTTRPQFVQAMVEAYLAGWATGSRETKTAQVMIVNRSRFLPRRWALLFQTCPEFLDARDGPAVVGQRMEEQRRPFDWLISIGLPAPHGMGFMESAHRAFLGAVPDPRSEEAVERLIGWAMPPGSPALDDRRAAQVIDRIVFPWLSETCPETLRAYSTKRIIDAFGDPRRERAEFWRHTRAETKRVLFKWLARSSMETIFEIVTEAERGKDGERQWRERRRFWTGIYEEGRIDEAWVALGRDAERIARSLYRQTQDKAYLNYALQTPRNDTCLLFMKIGGKIFLEGSHNFRIHVFPTPSRRTPEFYAGRYQLDDILLPHPHIDARVHSGRWQDWVRQRLRR